MIAVTVLTSLSDDDVQQIGLSDTAASVARGLARLANDAGIDGVVCSAHEAADIKRDTRSDFLTVTPGIRPAYAATGDQKRVMTPKDAIDAGAVIARIEHIALSDAHFFMGRVAVDGGLGAHLLGERCVRKESRAGIAVWVPQWRPG